MDRLNILSLFAISVGFYFVYCLCIALYNVTLHPLAKYPGPKLYGAFYFPQSWDMLNGTAVLNMRRLHVKYGLVVRISPSALSFNTGQALRDIYGNQKGKPRFQKDPVSYYQMPNNPSDIIIANDSEHKRFRRLIGHGFSDSALREQETMICSYCDLLITKLREQVHGPAEGKVDIVSWFMYTTFDIIGDLALGESFHALENGQYHEWIRVIISSLRTVVLLQVSRTYPVIKWLLETMVSTLPGVCKKMQEHSSYTRGKTRKRIESKDDRKDFMTYILRNNDEKGMLVDEIIANAGVMIIAGSETTASVLSALTFYLLTKPKSLEKLTKEIRHAFTGPSYMTFARESQLGYLNACIKEVLRLHPAVPMLLIRLVPPEGGMVDGHFIPGKTTVVAPHYATFTSPHHFKDPLNFVPERWLGDGNYADDDLWAVEPFSLGTRNCVGKNLGLAELRAIMIRLLWNFDIEICGDSKDWNKGQKVFILWEKPLLNVKLTERASGLVAAEV